MVSMSQAGPGNLLDHPPLEQAKKPKLLISDPQIPRRVLGDGVHYPAGNAPCENKSVIFQVPDSAKRGDPNPASSVLKKRLQSAIWQAATDYLMRRTQSTRLARHSKSVKLPVPFVIAALCPCAALAVDRNLSITPSVQASESAEPNAPIPVR